MTAETKLSVHADEIFEHIAAGMTVRKLAHRFGMSRSATWRWLCSPGNERRYREILRQRADDLVSEATALIDSADPTNVGVRREQVRHRQWLASRLDPNRFGDRPLIQVNAAVQISAGDALKQIWQARVRSQSNARRPALPHIEPDPGR